MKKVIIRIAAYFTGAALVWGCFGEYGPSREQDGPAIDFRAGTSLLLGDDDTRAATLHPTTFTTDEDFSVFAVYNNDTIAPIFNGVTVTYNGSTWGYLDAKHWEWRRPEDRYDFIAVCPAAAGAERLRGAPGRLTVSTDYDITADNFDLMVALYSRSGEGTMEQKIAPVPMTFNHRLAAVRVDVINISGSGTFKVDSTWFENVTNRATLKSNLTSVGKENHQWIDAETTSLPVRKEKPATGAHNPVAPGDTLEGAYNLLIPSRLDNGVNLPALRLGYTYTPSGGVETSVVSSPIYLKDILRKTDNEPITEWKQGTSYIYEIHLRLDGGVEVRVITTEWNEETYETPGIMIPE